MALCAGLMLAGAAHAENYPSKPIHIVVPYAPGGFNDTIARIMGKKLQEAWGQAVIVDNRPGAGTMLGLAYAAKAPADGYTLVVVGFPWVANQFLQKRLPYDTVKDFTPIILGGQSPDLLVVNAKSPVHSAKDLVAAAKSSPGKLNFATAGNGTSNHLAMEYFDSLYGIRMNQIPYRGSGPMVTDLLGGQVDVMFDNAPHVIPHVKAGQMRALAITSKTRSPLFPDVPTMAEAGVTGFEVQNWQGLVGPAGLPANIVKALNDACNKALADPAIRQQMLGQGNEIGGGTPEQFAAFIKAEAARWGKVVKTAHIRPE
jgi:tripartite-type tricarboxylate transporter receptor subunit TctC